MVGILWHSHLSRARRAARSEKWSNAALFYQKHLAKNPQDGRAWMQFGHCLKQSGDFHAAMNAYRQATNLVAGYEEGWIHLAYVERSLGNREGALAVLKQGLDVNPQAEQIIGEILALGERSHLPASVQTEIERRLGHYGFERYDVYQAWAGEFDDQFSVDHADVVSVIFPRADEPEWMAVTRHCLNSSRSLIVAEAVNPPFGEKIVSPAMKISEIPPEFTYLLLVEGGCRIAADAIDLLRNAMERTGARAAYCDHDHWEAGEGGFTMRDPCFQPMKDPVWFQHPEVRPPCMLIARTAVSDTMSCNDLLSNCMSLPVAYAHVPLVKASRPYGAAPISASKPIPAIAQPGTPPSTQVIVQTRDAPDMLERCILSLRKTAARPDLLDILVVNNRSILPETKALLDNWTMQGVARFISHDEPFNWARANNIAVQNGHAPQLLFLNNDVEMESENWDLRLHDYIGQDKIGAVGALLLYPDRRIQHAGVVFGMGTGGPVHEGVGQRADLGGPGGRWHRPRLASAVTGAWLATTRSLFDAVDGFDESLAVAFNDIDFCLRCRAADHFVVQASDIVAMHRESATRGTLMSSEERARDEKEWSRLRARWGDALNLDPAYNPHWVRIGQPFNGFAKPSQEALSRWIMASARPNPWAA